MKTLLAGAMATLALCNAAIAAETDWPNHAVRIVVPFTAGSFTDTAARALARELNEQFKQPFVVENRVGAGGLIGTDAVAKAKADGYTLLFGENSLAITPSLYKTLPYDPAKDIVQVAQLAEIPAVIVGRKDLPAHNLKELVEVAKAKPDSLTFGSAGQGTSAHLGMEAFLQQANIKVTHIPYKGISAAMVDVLAGRIDLALGSVGSMSGYIQDGRVQGLALSGSSRHPMFPQVPTFAEQGYPEYSFMYWFGLMAPSGTPQTIVDKLEKAVEQATQAPNLRATLDKSGVTPKPASAAEFSKRVHQEQEFWRQVVKQANIQPE